MKHVLLLLCITGTAAQLNAQSNGSATVNVAGGSFAQGHLYLDWSIGETALVTTMSPSSGQGVLTNGLLQPNTMLLYTSQTFTPDEIRILPNPTFNTVEINILTAQQGDIDIYVYDITGKSIVTKKTFTAGIGKIEKINLTSYAAGTYIIKLDLNPLPGSVKKTGSYKIIKY